MDEHPAADDSPKTKWWKAEWPLKLIATAVAGSPAYSFADGMGNGLLLHAALSLGFIVVAFFLDAATGVEQAYLALLFLILFFLLGRAMKKVRERRNEPDRVDGIQPASKVSTPLVPGGGMLNS